MQKQKIFKWCIDGAVLVLLIACLWVPQGQKAIARAFVWTNLQHWDENIMLPGYAHTQGQGLNTDIYSPWGMGAVMAISRAAQILGNFDYINVLNVMILMAIVYYAVLYVFMRIWLGNILVAVFGVAVAVKIQMFHAGVSPLVWNFPQDTPARHWLDIPVLWCLWQHTRQFKDKYLLGASIGIGISLAWVFNTGLCLLTAYWGYLIFLLVNNKYRSYLITSIKDIRRIILIGLAPLMAMSVFFYWMVGQAVFHPEFWKNIFEPIHLFLLSANHLSIYTCLFDRHFFAFITSFVIPIFYVWTLIVSRDLILVPLSLYGLILYIHYLAFDTTSHYYAVGIPVVMVICYWVSQVVQQLKPPKGLTLALLLAICAWGALLTNIFFVYYPNIFDIIRMDWNPEINFYQQESHFQQDAAMISRLTSQTQGAALISSFETTLLLQAQRKPFFYYAPLVSSERLDINGFAGTSLITQDRLNKTLIQIAQGSPEYIFIEKRLLGKWPAEYVQRYPGIVYVLQYIVAHYSPQEQGMILIAMHRKP